MWFRRAQLWFRRRVVWKGIVRIVRIVRNRPGCPLPRRGPLPYPPFGIGSIAAPLSFDPAAHTQELPGNTVLPAASLSRCWTVRTDADVGLVVFAQLSCCSDETRRRTSASARPKSHEVREAVLAMKGQPATLMYALCLRSSQLVSGWRDVSRRCGPWEVGLWWAGRRSRRR